MTPVAPTTLVKVAASPALSCTVATGAVAAPAAGELTKLTEPVALEPTATVAGKLANAAAMSAATAATLNSAVLLAGLVSLPAPVVAVPATPPATWVNPIVALMVAPGASVGAMPVKLATPVAGL